MNKQKTILVVEDEKDLREAIKDALLLDKFLPLEARDGKEGVEIALSKHPDLILMDLVMPEMDGMTVLKKIRADAWGSRVPVIILTNLSATNEQTINDIVTHKPMNYLIKSDWKIHDVIDKVKNILASQSAQ